MPTSVTTAKRQHAKDLTVAEHNNEYNKSDNPVKQIAEGNKGNEDINESGSNVENNELKRGQMKSMVNSKASSPREYGLWQHHGQAPARPRLSFVEYARRKTG